MSVGCSEKLGYDAPVAYPASASLNASSAALTGAAISGAMTRPTPNRRYSPSMRPSAPACSGVRASAPPTCRSSAIRTGTPGWTGATNAASAASSSSPTVSPALRYGIGSSGSMWMWLTAAGDEAANVSISGSSARRAASASAPSAVLPAYAPSISTTDRPDRNGGSSGSGGKCMIRNAVVTSSGAARVQSRQARRTSAWRSYGHSIMPA